MLLLVCSVLPSFVKHSGAFRVNSIVLKIGPCKDGSIGVSMAVALFNGTGVAKYCGAPAAAADAKSLLSCPTLCDPIDGGPPGSSVPGILQARTLEWVAIFFSDA